MATVRSSTRDRVARSIAVGRILLVFNVAEVTGSQRTIRRIDTTAWLNRPAETSFCTFQSSWRWIRTGSHELPSSKHVDMYQA